MRTPCLLLGIAGALLSSPVARAAPVAPHTITAAGPIQFSTPTSFPFGGTSLELADMNGDGRPDAVSIGGGNILVRINQGGLVLSSPVAIPMGGSNYTIADLDGDGRLDLIAVSNDLLLVRRNLGWPSFASAASYALAFTGNGICGADLDGDGRPEIIVSHADSGRVSVCRNRGDGTLEPAAVYEVLGLSGHFWGTAPFHDVATGNFNEDLNLDVAIVGHPPLREVAILLNQGDGTFGEPVVSDAFYGLQAHVAVGDMDGNGLDDLAIGSEGFGFGILRGIGSGLFAPSDSVLSGYADSPKPRLVDVNADGAAELVAPYQAWNNPYDALSNVLIRTCRGPGQVPNSQEYLTGFNPMEVAVADLDGDGDLDVMGLTRESNMYWPEPNEIPTAWIYRNRGVGLLEGYRNFACLAPCPAWNDPPWMAGTAAPGAPADLFRDAGGHIQWWRNSGHGAFADSVDLGPGMLARVTDLNHDGRSDLVLDDADAVRVRLSIGDGQWGAPTAYTGGSLLGFADFDADGERDLAALDGSRNILVRPGDASGGFGPAYATGVEVPATWRVDLGDLDGDGRAEVVLCPSSSSGDDPALVVSPVSGAAPDTLARIARWCPPWSDTNCAAPRPFISPAAPGHPGFLFLLASPFCCEGGTMRSYRCDPNGELHLVTDMVITREAQGLTLADFDLDGIPDVVLTLGADFDNGNVIAFHCDADGTLTENWSDYPGPYPYLAVAGDFDGDSKPDLLIERREVGRLAIFTNTTATDEPTPALLSLVSAHATDRAVTLDWFGAGLSGVSASLERRTTISAWEVLATLVADGTGHFRFEDDDVSPGARYAYRLIRAGEIGSPGDAEVWVDVPARVALEFAGVRPNPVGESGFVHFSLATECEVRLAVLDVQGRRLATTPPERLPAGNHALRLPEPSKRAPGIYLLRLSADGTALTRRFVVVR